MNTREIAAEYRLSHWAEIMRERRESGKSIKAFCKDAGYHENVYFYWQRKLREAACKQMGGETQTVQSTQGFAEVRLAELPAQTQMPGEGQLRIDIGGVHITADSTYPATKLAELLRELSRSC